MKHIYHGKFSSPQMKDELIILHAKIHWLLIYREENYPLLDAYFVSVLEYIASLNELLGEPKRFVDLMNTLHEARRLNAAGCDFKQYRRKILEAHSKLDEMVGDLC